MGELYVAEIAAMRDRASAAEALSKYERGLMTCGEVLSAAWQACHDHPELQGELVRQFRAHPNEFIPCLVGDALADLASQSAAGHSAGGAEAEQTFGSPVIPPPLASCSVRLSERDEAEILSAAENPPAPNEAAVQAARRFLQNHG